MSMSCPICGTKYTGDIGNAVVRAACDASRDQLSNNDLQAACVLAALGNAYGDLGDAARQRDLLERALAIDEREYGPDHREVAITLTSLGNACGDLGDAARQRDLSERTLAIMEREYGPDHREVAITLT